jgi:hypothetical protein
MAIQDEKLSIASLTGGEKEGAGAFDELMRTVKSHLSSEYQAGRITGDNYTNAYISSLDMALGNAAQYLLSFELANQQAKLIDEQIANAKVQLEISQKQVEIADKQLDLLDKQISKADKDTELVTAQVLVQTKQLDVMDQQIDKMEAEVSMLDQQTINAVSQNTQITTQTSKIESEKVILDQRLKTEEAQTKDTIDGNPVGGVIGKQIELYQNQADGYIRDAEQKTAKIYNDTFVTTMSTDADAFSRADAGIDDTEMAKVMEKLRLGINVT